MNHLLLDVCVCAGTKPLGLGQREADAPRPQHGLGLQPVHHHFPGKFYFGSSVS